MPKNLVLCLDGTGNQFGRNNSNVVKLFQVLTRNTPTQVSYYDPGVGTMGDPSAISAFTQKLTFWGGLAFGAGLPRNVTEAYLYLMDRYEPGDRIYIFGFSRGAYTARALAGMLHKIGLLERGADNNLPYAFDMFRAKKNQALAAEFKRTFARDCPVHFVGVWDTVSSVGWIYNPVSYPYTWQNPSITNFRHAISIDERRTHFRANQFRPDATQDCKQVWFPGVHADIGGGYAEEESGLGKLTLQWMLKEAAIKELLIDSSLVDRIVLGQGDAAYTPPNAAGVAHDELRHFSWKLAEHLPRRYVNMREQPPKPTWTWSPWSGFYLARVIRENSSLHQSVLDRMKQVPAYQPSNLPQAYTVEPY